MPENNDMKWIIRTTKTIEVVSRVGGDGSVVRTVEEYWTGQRWDLDIGNAVEFDSKQVLDDYIRTHNAALEAP